MNLKQTNKHSSPQQFENEYKKGLKNATPKAQDTGYHMKQFSRSKWLRIGKMYNGNSTPLPFLIIFLKKQPIRLKPNQDTPSSLRK